jgi:hypothetical protein
LGKLTRSITTIYTNDIKNLDKQKQEELDKAYKDTILTSIKLVSDVAYVILGGIYFAGIAVQPAITLSLLLIPLASKLTRDLANELIQIVPEPVS